MNISTSPVSFSPASAAQPTDVLRRDNQLREFISQINQSEAFNRERGLGSDSERSTQPSNSYANQLAEARIEAGFPRIHERQGESEQGGQSHNHQREQRGREENQAEPTSAYRAADGSYDATGLSANFADFTERNPVFAARGERIERFYQGSYRPNESFLLGVA